VPKSKYRNLDPLTHSDEDLLRIMDDDWSRSNSHYQGLFEDMTDDWKQFLVIQSGSSEATPDEQGDYDPEEGGRANFKTGLMRKHLSTATSLIMKSLSLSENNYAEWLIAKPKAAFAGEDMQIVQNDLELYRQYRTLMLSAEHMGFYDKFEGYITQGLVFYWSLLLLHWRREGRWVPVTPDAQKQMLEDFEESLLEPSKRPKKKYDMNEGFVWDDQYINRPEVTVWHTANTRPDPRGGMNLLDCAYVMDEVRVSWNHLYANDFNSNTGLGIYFNLDKLAETVLPDDSTQTKEEEMRLSLGEQPADGTTTSDKNKEKDSFRNTVLLHRYWTHFGVVTADRVHKVIISKRRYTKMPIYPFRYSIDWTKFDAQSFARLLRGVDENEDMLTNYRLDNFGKGIDGIVAVNDSVLSADSKGKPRHAASEILFDGPVQGNFEIIHTNDVTYGALEDRKYNQLVASGLGGITENMSGQINPGGRRLATEIQSVEAGGANRGGQLVDRIEQSILTPLMNDMTLIEAARMNSVVNLVIQEKGDYAFPMIDSEFIRRMTNKIRFIANGSTFVNQREIEMAGIINFANTFGANPIAQQFLEWPALLSIAAKRVARLPDPDVILSDQAKSKISIPPDMEWILMQHGIEPQPQYNDDDEHHLQMHQMQYERALLQLQEGKIDEVTVMRLQKHIAATQQKITRKQQASAAQPGPMPTALPGERGSENTSGTQTANVRNPQPPGVRPPVPQGVT